VVSFGWTRRWCMGLGAQGLKAEGSALTQVLTD
jgi:hypothetical protein